MPQPPREKLMDDPATRERPAAAPARERAAAAGVGDLLRLGARVGSGYLRHGRAFDAGAACYRWARELLARGAGDAIAIELRGRRLEIVGDRAESERVLAGRPDEGGYPPGSSKVRGMGFLADRALTIAHGESWARLRPFNERVLGAGAVHPFAEAFLGHVRAAFAAPVADREDVQRAMGRAMLAIVVGPDRAREEPGLAAEVAGLFGVVQSPLRRRLLGFHYRRRRAHLYGLLSRWWEEADPAAPNLLSLARTVAPRADREELLQQVPHWMFTFTGSATDLLARTLALVTARPPARARVLGEVAAAGPLGLVQSVARLPYLDACLRETGRLFPPVTRTFHDRPVTAAGNGRAAGRDTHSGGARGRDTEIVHWFPLLQRDDALGATVHSFRPERWLAADLDSAAAASNLFLRGPRSCPGMDLVLFVCRAALARQVAELGVVTARPVLAHDPLPISFPARAAHFTSQEAPQ